MRRFVEDYPSVDIGLLKRRGLFSGGSRQPVEVQTVVGAFSFHFDPLGYVVVTRPDQPLAKAQRIELGTSMLRFGERIFFVCPKTRRRVAKLYFVDGGLASREGHGLVHLTTTKRPSDVLRATTLHTASRLNGSALGKAPARGARKAALITTLVQKGDRKWIDPKTVAVLRRAVGREIDIQAREERTRRLEGSTTAFALSAGLDPRRGWTEAEIVRELAEPLARTARGEYPPIPETSWQPEWLPRAKLDARTLAKAGLFEPGAVRAACLIWDRELSGIVSYTLLVSDFTNLEAPYLFIETRDTFLREAYPQVVPLKAVHGRWYLVCPFSKSRRTTLYLREGWFGSDKGLNLRHPDWIAPEPKISPTDGEQEIGPPHEEEFPI